jgi:hypothetical protein
MMETGIIMKKVITKILLCGIVYSTLCVINLHCSDSDFGRQWGAMGTLHQAPTYFTAYTPEKSECCRKNYYKRIKKKITKTDQSLPLTNNK